MALDPEPAVADLLPERGGREVPVQALLRLGLVFEARVECWWIEDETEGHGALLEETHCWVLLCGSGMSGRD
jgi:hypothetical protein